MLAKEQLHHKAAEFTAVLGKRTLANECHCQELGKCTAALAESALAMEQIVVWADFALTQPALAKDKQPQEETAKIQCRADKKCVMALVLPPNPIDAAIERIWAECALLAAPLDAILAKITRNSIVHDVRAPLMTTSPHPAAVLSPPHCPAMYKDAVLSTMGGSLCTKSLIVALLSCLSTTVNGQLLMAHCDRQPSCCVGQWHGP